MNREIHRFLAIALGVQLLFIAIAWWGTGAVSKPEAQDLLVQKTKDLVRLELLSPKKRNGQEDVHMVFVKKDAQWQLLPSHYPLKDKALDNLLKNLDNTRVSEVIASQKANYETLHVGERVYDRKLICHWSSGKNQTLWIGQGQAGLYVRREGDPNVYRVRDLHLGTFSDRLSAYIDTAYVKVETKEIKEIYLANGKGTIQIVQKSKENKPKDDKDKTVTKVEWEVVGLTEDQKVDENKVSNLVYSMTHLYFKAPVSKKVKPEYGLDDPEVQVEWVTQDDQSMTYAISKSIDGKRYLKAEDKEYVVEVSESAVQKLIDQSIDDLVLQQEEEEKNEAQPNP